MLRTRSYIGNCCLHLGTASQHDSSGPPDSAGRIGEDPECPQRRKASDDPSRFARSVYAGAHSRIGVHRARYQLRRPEAIAQARTSPVPECVHRSVLWLLPLEPLPKRAAADDALHAMGFTNVKVLYIANNFGTDWVDKGYAVARGD